MGAIKETKLDNGNIELEITYGGKEAPFGGVDTSAPPAYIDPKCFTDAEGFLVVSNMLVAASLTQLTSPAFWSGITGITLLKAGTFYNSIYGQMNYAFGYTVTYNAFNNAVYNFYMTAWYYNGVTAVNLGDDVLSVELFAGQTTPVPAFLNAPVSQASTYNSYDTGGTLGMDFQNNGGTLLGTVSTTYLSTDSLQTAVQNFLTAFAANATVNVAYTATATADGNGIVISTVSQTSAVLPTIWGVADNSYSNTSGFSPKFYFPFPPSTSGYVHLRGGTAEAFVNPPAFFTNVSVTAVGGTLYIANLGPLILKYSGPSSLQISTTYQGVGTISKFAGSLIGLRQYPSIGSTIQNQDMIVSWTTAGQLDEWAPLTSAGLVTGAGFAQLADTEDALIGLCVLNNTAFILRAQGISYIVATGSSSSPFQFYHVGLGKEGEGAQNVKLVCQYGTFGLFVGNTNIYQLTGAITPIGDKIKNTLFPLLAADASQFLSSEACSVSAGGCTNSFAGFSLNSQCFTYNSDNATWMKFFAPFVSSLYLAFETLSNFNTFAGNNEFSQSWLVLARQLSPIAGVWQAPKFYALSEGIANTNSLAVGHSVAFQQEELLLGRDVTVDAFYISLWGQVSENVTLSFYVSGVLFSTYVMTAAKFNSVNGVPLEIQIFPTSVGVFTAHSPQLSIQIGSLADAGTALVRFSKIQMYASFDPTQKPV